MGKETSERIQTSILNGVEKKVLVWLAKRQPKWMTSDGLTYLGVIGSIIFALGGYLANLNSNFLWLASFGLVIHWYGDSLDGTLARVRNAQRPVYGFFIDHTMDVVTTAFIFLGVGLSPMLRMDIAFFAFSGYLALSVYTYICIILKNEFRLTYGKFGPTEFRLLLIVLCILYMYSPWTDIKYSISGVEYGVFDIIGIIISLVLYSIYIVQFIKDRKMFSIQDPSKQ